MNHTENIQNQWTKDLALYIQHLVSPDGRDTFESTPLLAEKLYELSSYKEGDTLLDLGCGWGRSLAPFVPHFKELIGVDMSVENLTRTESACTIGRCNDYRSCPAPDTLRGILWGFPKTPHYFEKRRRTING